MTEQTKKYLTTAEEVFDALADGKTVYCAGFHPCKMIRGLFCRMNIDGSIRHIGDAGVIAPSEVHKPYLLEDAPFIMSAGKWVDFRGKTWMIAGNHGYGTPEYPWLVVAKDGEYESFNDKGQSHLTHQLVRKIGEWGA